MFYSLSDPLECRSRSLSDNKGLRLTEPALKTVQAPNVVGFMTGSKFIRIVEHHEDQLEGYIYVFVPPYRYDRIQKRRLQSKWTTEDGKCPVNNFKREFDHVLRRASIEDGEFHDLRRTCMTRWFVNGLTEFDVMKLAGHSDFSTTHKFYLAVRRDLVEKARKAAAAAMSNYFGTRLARAPYCEQKELTGS